MVVTRPGRMLVPEGSAVINSESENNSISINGLL